MKPPLPFWLAIATLIPPATAQLGAPHAVAGVPVRIDVGTALFNATGYQWPGVLGCARDAAGHFWVAARRRIRQDPSSPHMLFELDPSGAVVSSHPQPIATATSRWGIRDLAYDGSRWLYGGCEADRIFAFDTLSRAWTPTHDITVPAGLTFGTMRALAFDPTGDGGRGSLWCGSWSSEHVELSLTGSALRRLANVQPETFGAALDPVRRSVWWFGQTGSSRGANTRVVATELDLATGLATGSRFFGDLTIPGIVGGGIAGGVEFYVDQGGPVLLLTVQADTDWIYAVEGRFHFGTSSGGGIGADGDAAYLGNAGYGITLDGSTNDIAALLVGLGEANVALPPGLTAAGSYLLIDLTQPNLDLPFTPVAAGSSRAPLPIPITPGIAGLDLWFQWIEIPLVGSTRGWPIATSNGGKVRVAR